jgi:hypothetical protein
MLSPPPKLCLPPHIPWRQTLASTAGISPSMRLPERSSMQRRRNTQIAGQRASGTGGRARETPSPRRRRKGGVLTPVVVRRRRNLDLTSFVGTSSPLPPCAPPCPLRRLPRAPPQRPRGASISPPRTQRLGHRRPGSAPAAPERPSPYRRPR